MSQSVSSIEGSVQPTALGCLQERAAPAHHKACADFMVVNDSTTQIVLSPCSSRAVFCRRHLRNWDIGGRVSVLDQRDVHCSLYPLNHRHLSLHHHRDVCSDLSEIILGRGKDYSSSASRPSSAAELTEHRNPRSTLQLHWTSASSLEECVATSTVCSSSTCGTEVSTQTLYCTCGIIAAWLRTVRKCPACSLTCSLLESV